MTDKTDNRFYREAGEYVRVDAGSSVESMTVRQLIDESRKSRVSKVTKDLRTHQSLSVATDAADLLERQERIIAAQSASQPKALTDDLLVQLFYAAQGDITQFRIKARDLLEAK